MNLQTTMQAKTSTQHMGQLTHHFTAASNADYCEWRSNTSICLSHGFDVQTRLNGSRSCLVCRLAGTKEKTLYWTRVPISQIRCGLCQITPASCWYYWMHHYFLYWVRLTVLTSHSTHTRPFQRRVYHSLNAMNIMKIGWDLAMLLASAECRAGFHTKQQNLQNAV